MPQFIVKGKGIETNRKRTKTYTARDENEAIEAARKDGTEPESVELIIEEPTDRQLAYARDLGIQIPDGISRTELSDLISLTARKDKLATERHKEFAKLYSVEISRYIGKKELFDRIQNKLVSDGDDLLICSWFTFRVYRELVNGDLASDIKLPTDPKIKDIASTMATNKPVVDSIKRYVGSDLIWFGQWTSSDGFTHNGGSNRTVAYKEASRLLKEHALIAGTVQPKQKKTINATSYHQKSTSANNEKSGCLASLALIATIPIGLLIVAANYFI
ncbi:hypothetical protein QNZ73_002345 [Vibrio parahaemolyticus]|nr:hypothetical protein [Vibrio parahaemolyticus]ELB2099980.1 hypothetical protein [Vibrio parahaemolyticus]ELB2209683.1 hypothetical protein [Vibrio parahaemolyticus]ELB2289499.1 hypothetical protein [Vibrio parahaemolyticus]